MSEINTLTTVLLPLLNEKDKEAMKNALVTHIITNISQVNMHNLIGGFKLTKETKEQINKHLNEKILGILEKDTSFEKIMKKKLPKIIENDLEYITDDIQLIEGEELSKVFTSIIIDKLK